MKRISFLKNKFGKYFEFKNTINGTDYFLRTVFGVLLFFIPLPILLGIIFYLNNFIGSSNSYLILAFMGIIILFEFLVVILMFWFAFATLYKRINAFFPKKAGLLLVFTLTYFLTYQIFILMGYSQIFYFPYWVWLLYLQFGNSPVGKENHIG